MITSEDFISSAELIQESNYKEIDLRNSASRAYYGAYHACVALALKNKLVSYSSINHDVVIRSLVDCKKFTKLGNQLRQCKLRRHTADYKLNQKFTYRDATQQLKTAKLITEEIQRSLSNKSA